MIELKNISKKFGKKIAVNHVSMKMDKNKITMLIGPSGCGKTTTLKMINRLIDSTAGDILINKESIYSMDPVELRRSIGYVIQETGLFPHMNVYDNVAAVPKLIGWTEKRIKNRVEELLELVTLNTSYMYKYPLQLSGGERQRVGLARALAADPEILLMDEPFGAIDPINRARLHDSFISIQERIKKTIVFVTHDINEAIKLGDKIAIMNHGELIQHDNVNNILYEPENEFVEKLLGHDRNIKALVLKKNRDYIKKEGFLLVKRGEKPEKIKSIITKAGKTSALAVNSNNLFEGEFIIKKSRATGEFRLDFHDDVVTLEKNGNLQETFSLMIETGNSRMPVVSDKNSFEGIIDLNDIFSELGSGDK